MKKENQMNTRKAVMVGCGFVGAATVFSLVQSGIFSEIVLIDADQAKAEGEAMDISHGIPYARTMKVYAGDYTDASDAAMVIITAGANQKPGETRLDLIHKNVAIFKQIVPKIKESGFGGILLVVSNPVDILTQVAMELSGLPKNQVLGSGTVLDTARLKYQLGSFLGVDSKSVHAFIIGEHGDSEIAAFSSATISGIPLDDFYELRGKQLLEDAEDAIAEKVRESAYEIIKRKQATYFGVAMAVRRICEVIMRDEKSILPVSTMIRGSYGVEDVVLSIPCVVGKRGVELVVPPVLNEKEETDFRRSAEILKESIRDAGL